MVRITRPDGDFDYKITFTKPSDSTTKNTESDEINVIRGPIRYHSDGSPATFDITLEFTTDSAWIDQLFLVDVETKGAAEGTWLNRFHGKVYDIEYTNETTILHCADRLEDRLGRVVANDRRFFKTLVDKKLYDIYGSVYLAGPVQEDYIVLSYLDSDARPVRPLISAEIMANWGYRAFDLDSPPINIIPDGDSFKGNHWLAQRVLTPPGKSFIYKLWVYIFYVTNRPAGDVIIDLVYPSDADPFKPGTTVVPNSAKTIPKASIPEQDSFQWTVLDYTSNPLEVSHLGYYYIRVRSPASTTYSWVWAIALGSSGASLRFADSTDGGSTWSTFTGHTYAYNFVDTPDVVSADGINWSPLTEDIHFSVDYENKKILFDRTILTQCVRTWGVGSAMVDELRLSYFKGYETIDNVIESIFDDFLSKAVTTSTINPTENLDLAPFTTKEGPILSVLKEFLKVGQWAMRLFKNASGNLEFEFTDAYLPAGWGSSPFTGSYADLRKIYHGDDAASNEDALIRIVGDHRFNASAFRYNSFSVHNRSADILIGARNPADITFHDLMSSNALPIQVADSLDEMVSALELLFQYYRLSRILGSVKVDRVSMLTADAMFMHCNDLVYIKDSRILFDGAFKLTGIRMDIPQFDFTLEVTDKYDPLRIDKLFLPGLGIGLTPDFVDQSGFLMPHGKIIPEGEFSLTRKLISVDDISLTYNAGYTYEIGIGDDDSAGTTMQNEIKKVACTVNETTGKIHTLDIDGDASDEYRLAIAEFDLATFTDLTSFPYKIKEVGLYNGGSLLKRLVLKIPWPGSPASNDFFHPHIDINGDSKLFVCWVITA